MKILIVDDSKSIHAFLRESLAPLKAEIVSVFDGAQGLDQVRRLKDLDLVLMDWEMPVMTGPEALKAMRQIALQLPIIMMTTRHATDDLTLAIQLGANEYMMKPFTPDILLAKIDQILATGFSHAG